MLMIESAQQSVHRTAGTLRVFGAGSERWQFPAFKPVSPQPPVTRAVETVEKVGESNTKLQGSVR